MKRRLILMGITFGLILVAFAVYTFFAGDGYDGDRWGDSPQYDETAFDEFENDDPESKAPYWEMRDDYGRLEGIFQAKDWDEQSDSSYLLTKPKIQRFMKSGQVLTITADTGRAFLEMTDKDLIPRSGSLDGNVSIVFDRGTEPGLPPSEMRPDDLVRIYVDDLQFNNDMLEITTDSNVAVFSVEADILGKGLILRWNEEPREIRTLEILAGDYMAIKHIPAEFKVPTLPDTARAPLDDPNHDNQQPQAALSDVKLIPAYEVNDVAQRQATTQPTTRMVGGEIEAQPRNIYKATFHDKVHVVSGPRYIDGADELSIVFQWDKSAQRRLSRRSTTQPAPQPVSPTTVAAAPSTMPATTQPADQPADDDTMIITWSGPLIIHPLGYADANSAERFGIEAIGDRITLADTEAKATCKKFVYMYPAEAGRLIGTDADPVVLSGQDDRDLICREVRFDRNRDLIHLAGPGSIDAQGRIDLELAKAPATQPVETPLEAKAGPKLAKAPATQPVETPIEDKPAPTLAKAAITPPAEAPGEDGSIRWTEAVVARLEQVDGKFTIREALFVGDVHLTGSQPGEAVTCDRLQTWLAQGPDGPYPRKAIARGNVLALWKDSNIKSDKATIFFDPPDANDSDSKPQVTAMVAEGNVLIANPDGFALARLLESQSNDANGLSPGAYYITGEQINFYQSTDGNDQTAWAEGPGSMAYLTDQDFDGKQLDKPRPARIEWAKRMDYNAKQMEAVFIGDVKFNSELSSISGQKMTVTFEEKDEPGGAKSDQNDSGIAIGEMKDMQVRNIIVDDDVLVSWRSENAAKQLVQRLHMRSPKLSYNAADGTIDCFREGKLLVEDYTPPKPESSDSQADDDDMSSNIETPWQTAFEWTRHMRLMLDDLTVIMDGDVKMMHLSGSEVNRPATLNLPDWPELPDGRITTLDCEKLIARFNKPPAAKGKSADSNATGLDAMGVKFGDLSKFTATKDVVLVDGKFTLQGQSLNYNRTDNTAMLKGYLPGHRRRNAKVTIEGNQRPELSSPRIEAVLEGGHVKKVRSSGGIRGFGTRYIEAKD